MEIKYFIKLVIVKKWHGSDVVIEWNGNQILVQYGGIHGSRLASS